MKVVLSTVYNLNNEQVALIQQVAKDCQMSLTEAVSALYDDGQLELEDCDLNYDKILYVG